MQRLHFPRYTDFPFPDRPYIPGSDIPKPDLAKAGLKTVSEAELASLPPNWQDCYPYLVGCDLYNHGYWWEAHYAWERIWRPANRKTPLALFLKGLIQVAAAHLLVHQRQVPQGAGLVEKAVRNLDRSGADRDGETLMGLSVPSWRADLQRYYAGLDPDEAAHRQESYPYLALQIDRVG